MRIESEHDVVVVGGGTAGVIAAIAAARNGMDTLLIERYGFLGGMMTAATVNRIVGFHTRSGELAVGGIPFELIERLTTLGGCLGPVGVTVPFDPETMKYMALEMVEEAGVKVLLHSLVVDTIMKGEQIRGVVVENKGGRQLILGKIIIDTTGEGSVAFAAGAPFEQGRKEDGAMAHSTLIFRMGNVNINQLLRYMRQHPEQLYVSEMKKRGVTLSQLKERYYALTANDHFLAAGFFEFRKKAMKKNEYAGRDRVVICNMPYRQGEVVINVTDAGGVPTDPHELTRIEIETRKQAMVVSNFLKKYVPGFKSAYLMHTPAEVGPREKRRIIGEYVFTEEDVLNERRFDDAIGRGCYDINLHLQG